MQDRADHGATQRRTRANGSALEHIVRHRSGLICLVAVLVFVGICATMQWVRSDLDWRHAPLSFYLKGPYGGLVRAAYYQLSLALMLLGLGLHAALRPGARSMATVCLLVLAGIGLAITAISETDLPLLDRRGENTLHGLAALTTFLSVTLAMLLQSWCFRGDDAWRHRFRGAFCLAVASFGALWVYAFWEAPPNGLMQKSVISLIMLWLGCAAWWLRYEQLARRQRVEATQEPPHPGSARGR